jgi:hypothetical protein
MCEKPKEVVLWDLEKRSSGLLHITGGLRLQARRAYGAYRRITGQCKWQEFEDLFRGKSILNEQIPG